MKASSVLSLKNVSYKELSNINMDFQKGKLYAITGKNKELLIDLISGIESNYQGIIYYHDNDLTKIDQFYYRSHNLGLVDNNLISYLTPSEIITLSSLISNIDIKNEDVLSIIDRVNLSRNILNKKVSTLSKIDYIKLSLARVLIFNPDIIVLVNPTKDLYRMDENSLLDIIMKLLDSNKCIIIVTDIVNILEKVDRIYEV